MAEKTESTSKKKTILVVEDDRFYANISKLKLTKIGYNVVVMANGAWALKAVEQHKPDLILLDLVMPEVDGFETLAAIKKNPEYAKIPIIVVTNLGQPEDVKKAKNLGASDYLVKTTVSVQQLVDKIKSFVSP